MNGIDLAKNPHQYRYYVEIMKAIARVTPYRKLAFGGAIRGGKTYISLAALIRLATRFPGSKSHIIRNDFPNLQATTIPSMEKILRHSPNWKWNREKANYFAYNRLDSKIYFKGENYPRDPELTDFLGLETNWIFLEQLEEIQKKTLQIAISRVGSWYIDPMPPGLILTTFNPTQRWPKEEIYIKAQNGELPADFYYQTALPSENAFVTNDQWDNWNSMDERYQKQFIQGDWTNFDELNNLFSYSFDAEKHVGKTEVNKAHPLILSFDFNVDPITCFVCQIYDNKLVGIEQVSLSNSDIYKLCEYLYVKYGERLIIVTGDASGQNRSALTKDNLNYYKVIRNELKLNIGAFNKVPKSNPPIDENRVLVNAVLHKYKVLFDKDLCAPLIKDMQNLRVLQDGGIDKKDKSLGHATDCFRYVCNAFLKGVIKV